MLCPKCGTQNPTDTKFCPSCGLNLTNQLQQNNIPGQPNVPAQQNFQQNPQQFSPQQNNFQNPQQNNFQNPQQNNLQNPQQMQNMQPGNNFGGYNNMNMQGTPAKKNNGLVIGIVVGAVVLVAIICAIVIPIIIGISSSPKQQILGDWTPSSGSTGMITFKNDGKGSLSAYGASVEFEYSISGNNELVMTLYGSTTTFKYDSAAMSSSRSSSSSDKYWYINGNTLYIDNEKFYRKGTSGNADSGVNDAQMQSYASTLNNACKTAYAGVVSGTITDSSKNADGSSCYWAASKSSSVSTRKSAAQNMTVSNAMSYSGVKDIDPSEFVYVSTGTSDYSQGTILYKNDPVISSNNLKVSSLSSSTRLGRLYS